MEDYVMSAASPAGKENPLSSPRADYTGTGNNNDTRMEQAKRSTMLGVNLFGSKKAKKVDMEKKVNFERDSDQDNDKPSSKRTQHYFGNF